MEDEIPTIHCSYVTEDSLYMSYMPFITGGALFVRTKQLYNLGDSVQLIVRLLDSQEECCTAGKVIWITPKGAQGNKPAGIGVQFLGENRRLLSNKIETYLAGMLKSSQMTDSI